MQCLVSIKLNIPNRGKKPNPANSKRKEVIDLTLGNDKKEDILTRWNASDQIPFLRPQIYTTVHQSSRLYGTRGSPDYLGIRITEGKSPWYW
jgi:hypothetical protein